MRNPILRVLLAASLLSLQLTPVGARSLHRGAAERVAGMVHDERAQHLASRFGLNVVNVMWEDTGRYLGSSVGPNISDVTIEVEGEGAQRHLMPVIRHPNFSDETGDIDIDELFVRVGNQRKGGALDTISLRELLRDPLAYLSNPAKGRIKGDTLLARRDDKVLVSAQSAFLPIPRSGTARFYPVIFNYQSYEKNPAVLTILVTRQGASMTVIDNNRDTVGGGESWGQRLYFNHGGERAPLTAERLEDVKANGVTQNGESADELGDDANVMMIIQVPLKVKEQFRGGYGDMEAYAPAAGAPAQDKSMQRSVREEPDLDVAVLGHGPTEGPYAELDGLTIERDPRFPVRVTVQFYQATSNGIVGAADMKRMAGQIGDVYAKADYVGSLVLDGATPRPTRWDGQSTAPIGLTWQSFPGLVERWQRHGRGFVEDLRHIAPIPW